MKSKIIKITAFLLLVIVGCFITFHFSNKEKVKADTPSLYYFDIDTSNQNYMSIILYVLDVANLQQGNCRLTLYTGLNSPPYSLEVSASNISFLRYQQLDHEDYIAYIYNYQYPTLNGKTGYYILVETSNIIDFDNNTSVNYDLSIPYYPTFRTYYNNGYDNGWGGGYSESTRYWRDTYFAPNGEGYNQIYNEGKTYGYNNGYKKGQESIDTTDWLQSVATDVGSILNIKLMPFITIGGLIFIPLMFTILGAILWIWRKK